jgi:O-antigen ligase
VAFVLAFQISGSRARHWFLQLMLGAAVVLAIAAIIQKYGFPTQVFGLFPGPSSVFGTFIYENQFAAFMEIAAPIALWRILRGDLIYGGVSYAILFGATIVSASRAGVVLVLLELVIFLAVWLLTRHYSTRAALPVLAVIFVLVSAAALIVGTDVIQERFESRVPERARVDLGYATLHMIRLRPATGFGMGAWPLAYPAFATFDLGVIANEAHDDWLQWTAEGGIPFALLIAILAGSLMLPAVRSLWGVGFLIVLVHSLVDYVLREPALAILWFAVGGVLCGYAQKTAGDSLRSGSEE